MPKASDSPASTMLKRCGAAVASLRAGDTTEQGSTSVGQCKGLLHASIQPPRAQPTDRPPPLLPASPRLDVSERQRTSVLAHILTHGKLCYAAVSPSLTHTHTHTNTHMVGEFPIDSHSPSGICFRRRPRQLSHCRHSASVSRLFSSRSLIPDVIF